MVCAAIGWLLLRAVYANLPPLPWTGVPALLLAAAAEAWTAVTCGPGSPGSAREAGRADVRDPDGRAGQGQLPWPRPRSPACRGFRHLPGRHADRVDATQDALTAADTFASAVVLGCAALYLENSCRVPSDPDGTDEAARAAGWRAADGRPGGPPPARYPAPAGQVRLGRGHRAQLLPAAVPPSPLYARATGASPGTAGLTTTALTLATVAAYLPAPALLARFGFRSCSRPGWYAWAGPALALATTGNLPVIMAACVMRGLGFAVRLRGGRRAHRLAHPGRAPGRGPGPGRHGQRHPVGGRRCRWASGWPATWATSWCSPAGGAAAAGRSGLGPVAARLRSPDQAPAGRSGGLVATLRRPGLARPADHFAATTVAVGVFVTFLPLALDRNRARRDRAGPAGPSQPRHRGRWLAGTGIGTAPPPCSRRACCWPRRGWPCQLGLSGADRCAVRRGRRGVRRGLRAWPRTHPDGHVRPGARAGYGAVSAGCGIWPTTAAWARGRSRWALRVLLVSPRRRAGPRYAVRA